ncbi:Uncharacterised protein [Corynebacterium kutscheri]|uniref:Uncharacterized protein n=1 Tax=Corynebacterium kutscheri TaxID=35755 RepID=A0AB38VRV2_9CORY|nr:Uncharacterised protein [Corynebacterium kutscheri]
MGGGFNDGVFYGAEFHATDASSTSITHTANYKNSGKPSFSFLSMTFLIPKTLAGQ